MSLKTAPAAIEEVVAMQAKLNQMIEALKVASAKLLVVPEAQIEVRAGERYAGAVLDKNGFVSHHLILLPGEAEGVTWDDAVTWAQQQGGELPTRQEQALLYANLKGEFKTEWYWSGQAHETDGSYAWHLYFSYGTQFNDRKSYEARARAVRRFKA